MPTKIDVTKLNQDNIAKLLVALETEEAAGRKLDFNMDKWMQSNHCGTVACIGGTCNLLQGINYDDYASTAGVGVEHRAAEWLGLTYAEASNLFYPREYAEGQRGWSTITNAEAINVLIRMATEGVIDWGNTDE